MRVLFPDISNPYGGKGWFLHGLVAKLRQIGVQVTHDAHDDYDVSLENIRIRTKTKRPIVVRLDGVYHDTSIPWAEKNASLKDAAERATAIVCQSEYGKRMVREYLNADESKISIIHNGTDLNAETIDPELTHQHNFVALSVWRPHKRLEDIIKAFLVADIPDSCLRILGKMGAGMTDDIYRYASDRVVFMGQITDRPRLLGYLKTATAMIHLCWFDCCPNSVVEAIGQRCPVICSNEGGTHELVEPSNGIVLPLDRQYDLKPVDLYQPPPVDINKVAEAMHIIVRVKPPIFNSHVDINRTAAFYKKVFESVL
jgi:glycosyltransferase involved in cell wall biosynthesis